MSASTHKATQCHNSEEHNLIYLEYLNSHVHHFTFTHHILTVVIYRYIFNKISAKDNMKKIYDGTVYTAMIMKNIK
jgi:hypothetical protein